jgi:hypothetical protein
MGEEMPMLSLDTSRKYYAMEQPNNPSLGNVFMRLHRRVKGEALNEECGQG